MRIGTLIFMLLILFMGYVSCVKEEYYIQKPEALIKISPPSEETLFYENDIIAFHYSASSFLQRDEISFSVIYPAYNSKIRFFVSTLEDLSIEIYNFERSIGVHEDQGALVNANIIENPDENIYGVLCYLEGNNIATSAQFFITDSTDYFIRGGVEFNTSINSDIIPQNRIMRSELLNFVTSFRWSQTEIK